MITLKALGYVISKIIETRDAARQSREVDRHRGILLSRHDKSIYLDMTQSVCVCVWGGGGGGVYWYNKIHKIAN